METPSREQLLENLKVSEEYLKKEPSTFFDGLQKILLGYAHLNELITRNHLPLETAAKVLAVELDLTPEEAKQYTEMYASIDWSENAPPQQSGSSKPAPKQRGGSKPSTPPKQRGGSKPATRQRGGSQGFFAKMIEKYPWVEDIIIETQDIWKDLHVMPPQRYIGASEPLVHWEDNTDQFIGFGFSTVNFLDRVADMLSRKLGVFAVDRFRPMISPTKPIPTQLVFSAVVLLFEIIRMLLTLLPDFLFNWISPFLSTIMACIELARGDWKHAILTLYGSIKSGFWSSMRWKMVLNTLTLISPETKNKIMEIALNTPRDIGRAFMFWLVTFVMPNQERIAKGRDLLYIVTGIPISGFGRLEVADFYKIRSLFSDSPIFCFTPVQLAIQKITQGDPWYIYLLPPAIVTSIQLQLIWPLRKAASILIAALITVPVMAQPSTISAKCGKPVVLKMYEMLRRIIDNKEKVKTTLPDSARPIWQKFINLLEYVDAPDKLLDEAHITMQEAFGPILNLQQPNGIRVYFQEDFLKQLEGFVKSNDKSGFKTWIHKFPKDQILDLNQSAKLLDPLVLLETGKFAAELSPVLKKVAKVTLKEKANIVDPLLSALSHFENPALILDKHGATPSEIIKPIVGDTRITALLNDEFLATLKKTAAASADNKIRFVEFISNYPKEKMFKMPAGKSLLELRTLVSRPPTLPPTVQAALKNFSVPALPSASQATMPSPSPRQQTRRRRLPQSRMSARGRVRTRKTRR